MVRPPRIGIVDSGGPAGEMAGARAFLAGPPKKKNKEQN